MKNLSNVSKIKEIKGLKAIEDIEKDILTEENLKALKIFKDNLKVISKVFNQFKSIKKEKMQYSKATIAKILDCKVQDLSYIVVQDFNKNEPAAAYFLTKLIKSDKNIFSCKISFNGLAIKSSTRFYSEFAFDIKNIPHIVKLCGAFVRKDMKYLILPTHFDRMYDDRNEPGTLWIICKNTERQSVVMEVKELIKQLNPIVNQVVTLSTYGTYKIEDFKPKFDYEDIIITNNIKEELKLITGVFKNYQDFKNSNIPIRRGILLSGIPGTGKTTIVNALIKNVIKTGGTVFRLIQEKEHQQRSNPVTHIFDLAKRCTPALIVLEDFDLLASSRKEKTHTSVSNELLDLLENKNNDVIVIATTNIIQGLDEAAIRSGRIDKFYSLTYPTLEMKKQLVELHKKYYDIPENINVIKYIEKFLDQNITGATIASLMLTAVQKSKIEKRTINQTDFDWAVTDISAPKTKKTIQGFN